MSAPALVWLRRDLRLADHPALTAAARAGGPVICVFIRDASVETLGAAAQWRLGQGLAVLAGRLERMGQRLILRSGPPLEVLRALIGETGATAVHWTRAYDPQARARDTAVKAALREAGTGAHSHTGALLWEPWTVAPKSGGFFRVYTPMWKAVQDREVPPPLPVPPLPPPAAWPLSERLESWRLGRAMNRGAAVLAAHARVGEEAAAARLAQFCAGAITRYHAARDLPAEDGTSALSENLTLGEISVRTCWHAARARPGEGALTFARELVWREFAWQLCFHTPHILETAWRPEWDGFGWSQDPDHPHVLAWKQGRTGMRLVDAAMRQMQVTGTMHNRGRMIVASYLTKHLMTHWKIGMDWFAEHLTDWDMASNAMGWQWAAGSGPDAAPYFRVFNPETQAQRFDPAGVYARRWLAEGQAHPPATALAYYEAIPRAWGLSPGMRYPAPVVGAAEGRARALAAYQARGF